MGKWVIFHTQMKKEQICSQRIGKSSTQTEERETLTEIQAKVRVNLPLALGAPQTVRKSLYFCVFLSTPLFLVPALSKVSHFSLHLCLLYPPALYPDWWCSACFCWEYFYPLFSALSLFIDNLNWVFLMYSLRLQICPYYSTSAFISRQFGMHTWFMCSWSSEFFLGSQIYLCFPKYWSLPSQWRIQFSLF